MLRHDPDIIMVGEVRDLETAEIAMRFSLTGHLVFSTLHTNNASSSINRLLDLGIEPYLIYSTAIAFVAQRLIRVLCPKCKIRQDSPNPSIIKFIQESLDLDSSNIPPLYKPVGCDYCNNTGFYGRSAIYEILLVDDEIKNLIMKRASSVVIENSSIAKGMNTMFINGLLKVINAETTMDELMNVVSVPIEKLRVGDSKSARLASFDSRDKGVAKKDINRRIYSRIDKKFKITFSIFKDISKDIKDLLLAQGLGRDEFSAEHNGYSSNLSAGGMLFKYRIPFVPNLILNMKLFVYVDEEQKEAQISCLAKVVRTQGSDEKGLYDIAVSFLDMKNSDRAMIDKIVKENQA
jgi:hypothetical protein